MPTVPGTPSSVTVVRSDGRLTASWPAVEGATSYHVTYLSDAYQDTWTAAALNHPTASITISSVQNSSYYKVAVRARNSAGDSGWRESPPMGPYTPAPPVTPSSVTVTRGDGTLMASWPAAEGATSYKVVYSSDNLASWTAVAGADPVTTSITIASVDNTKTYVVAVRSINTLGMSGWRNSAAVGPYTAQSNVLAMSLVRGPSGQVSNLSTLRSNRGGAALGIPLLPSAADPYGRQGVLHIVNRSGRAGSVRIQAYDDSAWSHEPLTLALGAGASVALRSEDIELGNEAKGLTGRTGPSLGGDWQLRLMSGLEIEVGAYLRHADGFVSSMHDVAPEVDGVHGVATFLMPSGADSARGIGSSSLLRLVNPGAATARVTITGVDGAGASSASGVALEIPAGGSRTLSGEDLSRGGAGLTGALGGAGGTWRLQVASPEPIQVMNLMRSPSGHLTNLSTVPVAVPGGAAVVPLFPAVHGGDAALGVLRLVNRSDAAGSLQIQVFDDRGGERAPLTLGVAPGAAVQLSGTDLERGNAEKGLSGGAGAAATGGDLWLRVTGDVEFSALAYARHRDGLMTSLHDLLPDRDGTYEMVALESGPQWGSGPELRLVGLGAQASRVNLVEIGSGGVARSGMVVEVPAGGSVTVPRETVLSQSASK